MPGFRRFGRPRKPVAVVVGLVLALILGWIVVSHLGAYFNDRYESFYPSLAEARKAGAIDRGWIPEELLPASSRSLHEVHDLSPSREWCAFEFTPADSRNLRTNLKAVDALPVALGHVPKPGVAWWPSALTGDLDITEIRKTGLDLYLVTRPATSVSNQTWLFAFDWSTGHGFFYAY
jgi:hypothetical protein